MPTARGSRTIAAPTEELWEVIRDPHHLPRWWPRVKRVEDVEGDAFTEVMTTAKGKVVRADFHVVFPAEDAHRVRWEQRVQDTPFAHVLKTAETEVLLTPVSAGAESRFGAEGPESRSGPSTEVRIELRQTLNGFSARFGGFIVRRAAAATIESALDGLERISG